MGWPVAAASLAAMLVRASLSGVCETLAAMLVDTALSCVYVFMSAATPVEFAHAFQCCEYGLPSVLEKDLSVDLISLARVHRGFTT